MKLVGLIPARAGSKRLLNKNLALLNGRPLIAYTCEAALASGVLSAVYVNTDSPAIATVAERFGVHCPALRPESLARDDTPTKDSNRFFLEMLSQRGETYDAVMVLQPTSPLRTADDIREASELFEANQPCAVVSVSPITPASWLGRIAKDGRFEPLPGEDVVYGLNGAIYSYTVDDYLSDRTPARTLVHPMPRSRGVDIDTLEDLKYAEFLLRQTEPAACSA
jgi:CMP-N,N'-diacetyllegionaminic acid synthase